MLGRSEGRASSCKGAPLIPRGAESGLVGTEATTMGSLESKFVALCPTSPRPPPPPAPLLPSSAAGGPGAGCAEGSLVTKVQGFCEAAKGKEAAIAERGETLH